MIARYPREPCQREVPLPEEVVICEKKGPVAVLRLNRPGKHNAINRQLSSALLAHLDALAVDDGVRVVVITGAGEKAFCAGADMTEALGASRGGSPSPF